MEFKVQKEVLDSSVKIVFAAVEDMDNHGMNDEWQAYRTERIAQLYNTNPQSTYRQVLG